MRFFLLLVVDLFIKEEGASRGYQQSSFAPAFFLFLTSLSCFLFLISNFLSHECFGFVHKVGGSGQGILLIIGVPHYDSFYTDLARSCLIWSCSFFFFFLFLLSYFLFLPASFFYLISYFFFPISHQSFVISYFLILITYFRFLISYIILKKNISSFHI